MIRSLHIRNISFVIASLLFLTLTSVSTCYSASAVGEWACSAAYVSGYATTCNSVLSIYEDGSYEIFNTYGINESTFIQQKQDVHFTDTTLARLSETGTTTVTGNQVSLSESKFRGPATFVERQSLTFAYISPYSGFQHTLIYAWKQMPTKRNSSNSTVSKKMMSEIKVDVTAADGGCCIKPEQGVGGTLSFTPENSGTVTIKIVTPSGEVVYNSDVSVTAGTKANLPWDGKSNINDSKPLSAGTYILHIEGVGINQTKKIVIVK